MKLSSLRPRIDLALFGVALIVSFAQATPAFAGNKRPREDLGEPAVERPLRQRVITEFFQPIEPVPAASPRSPMEKLTPDTLALVATYLDRLSLAGLACSHKAGDEAAQVAQGLLWKHEVSKIKWVPLASMTAEEITRLHHTSPDTLIDAPLKGFRITLSPVSVGFYRAVMGGYPDLTLKPFISLSQYKALRQIEEYHFEWNHDPDQPMLVTDDRENQAFINQLNALSGRHFRLPTAEEKEYFRRVTKFGAEDWAQGSLPPQEEYFDPRNPRNLFHLAED